MTRLEAAAALALILSWPAGPAAAGHGRATSFASIEWLPEPGRTPDELFYFLDTWSEKLTLRAAEGRREALEACLRIAREKLAELEAMVRSRNAVAARIAADRYAELVRRALAVVTDGSTRSGDPGEDAARLARTFCQALLEHEYILSVDYEILPRESRAVLVRVVAGADAAVREAAPRLSREDREPFAFKQNEVRWSVRMGMRDD